MVWGGVFDGFALAFNFVIQVIFHITQQALLKAAVIEVPIDLHGHRCDGGKAYAVATVTIETMATS